MVKVDAKVKGGSGIYNNGYLMEGGGRGGMYAH